MSSTQTAHAATSIVLASASPRRAELLRMLGVSFRVAPQDIPEAVGNGESPIETARRLAAEKAEAALASEPLAAGEIVLAADTIVVLGDTIYGKPADRDEAREVLNRLSGRRHEVISAVAVGVPAVTPAEPSALQIEHDCSAVQFSAMSVHEIEWYLNTGEWRDAAGGYKAQGRGAWFVDAIHGSFYSVMGLPIHSLYSILKRVSFRFQR